MTYFSSWPRTEILREITVIIRCCIMLQPMATLNWSFIWIISWVKSPIRRISIPGSYLCWRDIFIVPLYWKWDKIKLSTSHNTIIWYSCYSKIQEAPSSLYPWLSTYSKLTFINWIISTTMLEILVCTLYVQLVRKIIINKGKDKPLKFYPINIKKCKEYLLNFCWKIKPIQIF